MIFQHFQIHIHRLSSKTEVEDYDYFWHPPDSSVSWTRSQFWSSLVEGLHLSEWKIAPYAVGRNPQLFGILYQEFFVKNTLDWMTISTR
jgi:hypothetical protein